MPDNMPPWAHPRRCGEHCLPVAGAAAEYGSPPQVREHVRKSARHVNWSGSPRRCGEHGGNTVRLRTTPGLTPAGAGNIGDRSAAAARTRAHPRRCGEHEDSHRPRRRPIGSPPQVRGTFDHADAVRVRDGLTPAGAGNIVCVHVGESEPWAHPRRCGEHHQHLAGHSAPNGSPRRCGEHSHACEHAGQAPGSPPQVRGTCR